MAVLTLFFSLGAHAIDWTKNFGEVRVGAGADVIHEAGTPMAIASLSPASVLVWSHNAAFALAYPIGGRRWNAGFGGVALANTDDDGAGTHLNFYARGSYCGNSKFCLSFAHISHGAKFGIRSDTENHGLNFLFLEYRYR